MKLPVYSNPAPQNRPLFSKTLFIMKLMTAFILAATLHVSANSYTQQVTISTRNTNIETVFKDIRKQTGYEFIYDKAWLQVAKKINMAVSKVSLQQALDICFREQPFTYVIHEKTVILQPRELKTHLNQFNSFLLPPPQEVTGVVRDGKGTAIEGATVTLLPSQRTVATDKSGIFSFNNVPAGRHILWVTYVGFKKVVQNLTIGSSSMNVAVTMEEEVNSIEDFSVISTGYQALPRERATGSFGIISKEQLDKPTTNIATRLIGAVAGLQARRMDENGNPTLELRGQTSLSGNSSSPLVVVDGFPIQGEFNSINPNDVESITVLKDAAAASIWGARSANGVIVVVTKSARKGVPLKIDVSSFARIAPKLDLGYVNPLASSAESVEYEKRAFNKWGGQINTGSLLTNYYFQWIGATEAMSENYLGFTTVAQRDAILEKLKTQDNRQQIRDNLLANPLTQQYNISIQGSTGKLSNALSLLYESNQSNYKETYNKRYMLNYRTQANVTKWLDFNLSAFVQYADNRNNGVSLSDIQGISPYEMLKDENGNLTNVSKFYWPMMQRFVLPAAFPYAWTYNPIQEIQNRDLSSKQLNTRVQAGLTAKIIKGLSVESKIQYELFHTFNRNLYNDNTFYVRNLINTSAAWNTNLTTAPVLNLPKGSILTQNRAKAENYVFRNQVNFSRSFADKHQVDFVAGSEIQNFVTETYSNPTTYGYNDASLTVANFPNGPGGTPTGSGTNYQLKNWLNSNLTPISYINSFSYLTSRYFSAFGNLAYTYNNKYTVSASYRTDASNLITDDPKYRYDPFWSIGGSWQLYREKFFKTAIVDKLSVRATYGYNGNVDRSTSFMPLINMATAPNAYTNEITATISSFGNPTLRWEKTGTINLGADYSLFKGKLFGRIDVYQKKGKDLLATISIPAVYGTTSQKINNAKMTNKGIELEIGSALAITKNISWRGSLNMSYNQNRITNLFVATYTSSSLSAGGSGAYVVGKDANTMWTYEYAGVQNNQPVVKGEKGTVYDFTAFTPGDARNYMLASGTTVAPYTLGMINSFNIYDFNVSFILTGKFGHIFKRTGFNYPVTWTARVLPNNKLSEVVNGNPANIVPLPLNENEPRFYFWDRFYPYLNYLVESASHVRLQELNVTYNLKKLVAKTGIKGAQVFAQGNDLLTIKANKFGEDPEYPIGGLKPQPRYTFGVKLEL